MSNTVIHFGAGALGKGLVIPVLHDSGLSVTVVDADAGLVDFLNKRGSIICIYLMMLRTLFGKFR